MASTYDPTLSTNRDLVRFLVPDKDTTTALFQDEEIDAVLASMAGSYTSPGIAYFAAAALLENLHRTWMSRGKGVASKKTAKLAITFGTGVGINVDAAMQQAIKSLRIQGAHIMCPSPKTLAML
jgi:hypothetical protein